MPRMREVGRRLSRSGPFTAHEWEPRLRRRPWDRGRTRDVAPRASWWMTDNRGDDMKYRRLVGIDLSIASAHAVRVLDGEGTTLAKRKALPTVESLTQIETAALAGTAA